MSNSVKILGDGVSAYCCAHLLSKAGLKVSLQTVPRPRVPALVISSSAAALIRDIFDKPALFQSAHAIRRRMVAWERGQQPAEVEHRAFVVSEDELLSELKPGDITNDVAQINAEWTVVTSPTQQDRTNDSGMLPRTAVSWSVQLRRESSPDTCTMEALSKGWLFLIPSAPGYGWLLAVGDLGPDPLAGSKVVSREVLWLLDHSQPFSVSPRIASRLAGPNWLAAGSAAMTFDPICGDGVGQSVREAILAAAVVRAAVNGEPLEALTSHYESRMRAGFLRHLELVRAFYSNGFGGAWWDAQVPSEAKRPELAFQYRLAGFELQALGR